MKFPVLWEMIFTEPGIYFLGAFCLEFRKLDTLSLSPVVDQQVGDSSHTDYSSAMIFATVKRESS